MDVVSVDPGIVVVSRSQLAASEPLLHLYGLYRRAVVLRAEIQGAAWLQPTGDVLQERAAFAELRTDLAQQQIALSAGDLDGQRMAEELSGAMAAIEERLELFSAHHLTVCTTAQTTQTATKNSTIHSKPRKNADHARQNISTTSIPAIFSQ